MDAEPTLTVRPGRERSLLRRHPWVFGGSVQRVTGDPHAGDRINERLRLRMANDGWKEEVAADDGAAGKVRPQVRDDCFDFR